jgi:hypothetical protein
VDIEDEILIELDFILKEILSEFGIQNKSALEVNEFFTLSQIQKDKIDDVIQGWIDEK